MQRSKFMELRFQNLRFNGTLNDFLKADALIEEMENIQKNKLFSSKISLTTISKNFIIYSNSKILFRRY